MGHNHDHGHSHHHHSHSHEDVNINSAFIFGLILNGGYVIVQAIAGVYTHSMALLSDAGHNLGDVAGLALSLLAFKLAKIKPKGVFTYGYRKTTILAALVNAVVLLLTVGVLGFESAKRLFHPEHVDGGTVSIVAGIGLVINLASAMLFFKNKDHDLNTKGAYLHLMTDALVSIGVIVSGLVIKFTGWSWLDGAVSLAILITILMGTWSLLTGSLRMSLDAVPENVAVDEIEKLVLDIKGVENIHHTHIWAMSTTENALTAHVVLNNALTFDEKIKLVNHIKHELMHNKINHSTIELESVETPCEQDKC